MKAIVWVVAIAALAGALIAPQPVQAVVCVLAAIAWAFLFTVDHMEHRR